MTTRQPLHQGFVQTATRLRRKPALIDRTLGSTLSYETLLIVSLGLSRRVAAHGDGRIGILLPTGAAAAMGILATQFAGKVPVLINYATGATENSRFAQEKCGFTPILTSRRLLEKLNLPFLPGMIFLEDALAGLSLGRKLWTALQCRLGAAWLRRFLPPVELEDHAVILFTSGSERLPRAVPLTHRNIASNIAAFARVLGLGEADTMMAVLPFFHVFGFTVDLWMPLLLGMTTVTVASPLEYRSVVEAVREEGATAMAATPSFLGGYLRASRAGDFATLRLAVVGADRTPSWVREGWRKTHGIELVEGYGATETSPVVSVNPPQDNRIGSVGPPLPGVQIRIADLEHGAPLPAGTEGKILVKGELVMPGYLDDMEETSLRIRDGWYDTGDMGVLDRDGYLWHRGRLRRFVKIGGEMVSLVRVEAELETLLPDTADCCVVELPDSQKGARLVALVTEPVDGEALRRRLAERLPAIAVPRRLVEVESLPMLGSAKIDFRAASQLARELVQG